jgi:methylglutaconyl-CoA hydratase
MTDENPMTHPLVPDPAPDAEGPVRVEASPSGAVFITLDRAQAGNRMTPALSGALREAFETLHGADRVRVAFVRGAGGTFCAGRDAEWVRDSLDWTEADVRDDGYALGRMLRALREAPCTTVALVEGEAFDPGMGIVAACDLAIATRDARFGFPELKYGLLPSVPTPFVVEAIGPRQTQFLLSTGHVINAEEAMRLGLVQAVAGDAAELSTIAEQLTREVMACAPEATAEAKRLAFKVWGRPFDHALMDETAKRFAARRMSPEGEEGAKAFLEGRSPSWNL